MMYKQIGFAHAKPICFFLYSANWGGNSDIVAIFLFAYRLLY